MEWGEWSSCSYKDCDYPERRSQIRQCSDEFNNCEGLTIRYDDCPRDCFALRDLCCQNVVLNDDLDNSGFNGTFVFDQMLYDYPVFRHLTFVDAFLYRTNDEWRVGKGLFGNSVFYKSDLLLNKSGSSSTCPTFQV